MRFQADVLRMERAIATVTSAESPGIVHRMWTVVVAAIKRGLLGKSSNAHMKQFAGGEEYWDRAIAAQNDCLSKSQQPGADCSASLGRSRPPEFEPVHGWTKRQVQDYLKRNPAYMPTYEAALETISGRTNSLPELQVPRRQLLADGETERLKADFLVELHKWVRRISPVFQQFFYQATKDRILAHGRIDAEEAVWLRQLLCAHGAMDDEGRKFLHELKDGAKQVSREFEVLFADSMKLPQEQRTCG